MDQGELRLIQRLKRGDPAAYREFVERHQARVYRTVASITGNREDARDITQEVFLKAFEAIGQFRGGSTINTWLHRISVNLCIDQIRTRKKWNQGNEYDFGDEFEDKTASIPDTGEDPLDTALKDETSTKVQGALQALSEDHRTILILREVEGMPYEEIAEVLGVGTGTVMSRLHYARSSLKKKMLSIAREEEGMAHDVFKEEA